MSKTVYKVMRVEDDELCSIFIHHLPFKTIYPVDRFVRVPKGNIGFFAFLDSDEAFAYAAMLRARFSYPVEVCECDGVDPIKPLWIPGVTDSKSIQSFLNTMAPVFPQMTTRAIIARVPFQEMKDKGFRYLSPIPNYQKSTVCCTSIRARRIIKRG